MYNARILADYAPTVSRRHETMRNASRRHYQKNREAKIKHVILARREDRAVEEGKSSPITGIRRDGKFILVVDADHNVRAARIGVRMGTGERLLAHFEYRPALRPTGAPRWVVSLPGIIAPDLAHRAKLLVRRHGGYVQKEAATP